MLVCMAVYLQGLRMDETAVYPSARETRVNGGVKGKV